MLKIFCLSFLVLILICIGVPEIFSVITLIGSFIFICQLTVIISNLIIHSNYSLKRYIKPIDKLILITGCDSGFGLATAQKLDRYGFHVLAGVLSNESDGCKHLNTYASKRLRTIKLDVTRQEDVDAAVELVARLTNSNSTSKQQSYSNRKCQHEIFGETNSDLKLWALVNNAGVARFVPFEFGIIEQDLMPMFEVNLFGMARMTKAFLPLLRQCEDSRLVNVGSVTDRQTIAGLTGYSMSKHAVKSLTDGLRQELNRFKIKSILIEPTLYKTPISNIDQLINQFNQTFDRTDQRTRSDYGNETYKQTFISHLKKMIVLTRTNINEVVNSIEDAITNVKPRDQYWCASGPQKILFWIVEQLNIEFSDRLCTIQPPKKFVDFVQKINQQ